MANNNKKGNKRNFKDNFNDNNDILIILLLAN